jgi:hypothetical protein
LPESFKRYLKGRGRERRGMEVRFEGMNEKIWIETVYIGGDARV